MGERACRELFLTVREVRHIKYSIRCTSVNLIRSMLFVKSFTLLTEFEVMLQSICLTFWTLVGKVGHIIGVGPCIKGILFDLVVSRFRPDRLKYALNDSAWSVAASVGKVKGSTSHEPCARAL